MSNREFRGWGATDVGNVRDTNQDSFLVSPEHGLFVVADGVGGQRAGDVASQILVETIEEATESLLELVEESNPVVDGGHRDRVLDTFEEQVQRANAAIYQRGRGDMATTAEVLMMNRGAAYIAHVGDSRIYLLRDDQILRLTDDHTYAAKLKSEHVYGDGDGDPPGLDRFDHVLTRSVGNKPHVDVDSLFVDLQPGDRFLLCTDGITDALDESLLRDAASQPGELFVDNIVSEAKERAGYDNITAVVAEVATESTAEVEFESLDTMQTMDLLEDVDLFDSLDPRDILKVLRVVYKEEYAPGETIVEQGAVADSLYIIAEGEVSLQLDGDEVTRLGRSEHFGELALFGGRTRTADAVAAEQTDVLAVPASSFRELIEEDDPELGNELLKNLLARAADRLARTNAMVVGQSD
ncbi:MAG: cyclic nucleotide-binding domain-containing protein [Bradymonadaceae bacterium]